MDDDKNPGPCEASYHEGDREVDERCGDGYCRACHRDIAFEACLDGSWGDDLYRGTGVLPARLREPAAWGLTQEQADAEIARFTGGAPEGG